MLNLRTSTIHAADLPTYDPFKSRAPRTQPLTTAQQLVEDNRKRVQRPLRRRNTAEVEKSLSVDPLELGGEIWIPDPEYVWSRAEVRGYDGMFARVSSRFGESRLDMRELGDIYKTNPRVVDDMTSLYYIHEAGILHNLCLRSQLENQRPYTFMANVLIAVNPLRRLVEPSIQDYIRTQLGDRAPHPYAVAEVAFQQMALRTPSQRQSIVISGESGAGKTETSKIVLRYLTSREHVFLEKSTWNDSTSELDRRLLDTNPILEAFGNAKTLRNHNSSRFGKFMKLQFSSDDTHSLIGAYIETYLLEKSRLVFQIEGERNFHIFYFLLAGANDERCQRFQLGQVKDYHYLNQSSVNTDANIDDEILFDEVCRALETVGIASKEQDTLFAILSGLLHLGNIQLRNKETAEGDAGQVVTPQELNIAAQLLGVEASYLERVICEREIATRGEVFTIKRNAKEGGYVRDAIAKSVYQHLFVLIVHRINIALGHGPSSLPFIGVLDIFGFETFEYNDFEQLLINFANEALQATFNQQVFIAEQELFIKEGIEVGQILWPDNRECIDLISRKPDGILPLLDAEAKTQKPTDEKWNNTLHATHSGHVHFLPPHAKDKRFVFIVKHFATKVTYTVGNFIDKNNDTIPKDLEDLLLSSALPMIKDMYSLDFMPKEVTNAKGPQSFNKISVSSKFDDQMQDLVATLDATRCNFIRCVKPNPTMTVGVFDNGYVVDQLRCTGMLATCELLKVGLPTRVSYAEICSIYKPILPATVTPMFLKYNDRTFTEAVLWAFRVDQDAYRLGRTRVFFKTGKIALLDALLKVDMKKMGAWIVARLKKWLARRRWRYASAKILAGKGFIWLLNYIRKKKKAVLTLQAFTRMVKVRVAYIKKRDAYRRKMQRKKLARKRWKVAFLRICAQRHFKKRFLVIHANFTRIMEERRLAITKIQTLVRGALGRKRAETVRLRAQELSLRVRLAAEQAAEQAATSLKARRHWHAAYIALRTQKHFLDRLKRIHTARVTADNAHRKAAEEAERTRKLILNERNAAALQIQAAFRGFLGREDAKSQIVLVNAKSAALAAALAAEEAACAAEEVTAAHEAEAAAFRQLDQQAQEARLSSVLGGVSGSSSSSSLLLRHPQQAQHAQHALGSSAVPGTLIEREESLQEADLSWMAKDVKQEGEGKVESSLKAEELAQAGRDLFGEGGEAPVGPLMEADEENLINPVERIQEFPTGPPIPYKGGIFTCTLLGHRKQQDENWGDEYTEYVLRCTWGRDILEQSKTAWLVGGRYNDFNALHQELKAAGSGKRGKRAPWFPRFPKRHPFSSMIGKNQEEKFIQKREKELNRYMTQVLTQMPDALLNIHMDRFLNLTLRTQEICEREAYAEARKRWEEEEREAMANAADAEPLTDSELHEVEQLVHQLLEKIIYAQGDVRHDTQLQEMMHAVKVLQPRVAASAQIGAGVDMELVPLAMQLQDDILDAFNQYNDTLLALRLGHNLS